MTALVITLVSLLISLVIIAFSVLVTVGVMALTGFMLFKALKNADGFVISGPLVNLAMAGALVGPPPKSKFVKVGTCTACGAPRTQPARSAFVYCECCGQLTDWDFKAAMADRRSRAPGPAYEGLLRKHGVALAKAKAAKDHDAYTALQATLWQAYATACPAALSPRIGDPAYRKAWISWQSRAQTLQDLSERTAATFAVQTAATSALQWDRSNPFQPKAELVSYRNLLDSVVAHQEAVADLLVQDGLLAEHPDHVAPDVLRAMGLSVFVQGWLQYLPTSEHDATLAATGMDATYVAPEPLDLLGGSCPCCDKALEVVPNAKRVVCEACGHTVAVGGGTLPCHGCGTPLAVPAQGTVDCQNCGIHLPRIGL